METKEAIKKETKEEQRKLTLEERRLVEIRKEIKEASEIVFKFDEMQSSQIETDQSGIEAFNFRDPHYLLDLCKQYYQNQKITEKEWEEMLNLLKKYCSEISKNDSPRNIKWNIKNIEFENTFSYGKNNKINFENLKE